MVLRFIIVIIIIVLHFLTPRWFLSDFVVLSDYVMMLFGGISLVTYKVNGRILLLSLVLSLNALIYFLITTELITSDIGEERVVSRMQLIFSVSKTLPNGLGRFVEEFNALQVVIALIMGCMLITMVLYNNFQKLNK